MLSELPVRLSKSAQSVAVFHPRMGFGGSEAVAMWMLQALKRDYRIALVAGGRINLPELNAFCGTSIDSGECQVVEVRLPWPLAGVEWGAALRGAFVERSMRRHFDRFDVLISAYNVADFGRPAIYHMADFSWDEDLRRELDPPPLGLRGAIHTIPLLRRSYLTLSRLIAGQRRPPNLNTAGTILANSNWSRDLLRNRHGIAAQVLYPPVAMRLSALPPKRRLRRFVCLGRIYPEKRIERVVEILSAVRARGHDITLQIIGDTRETGYGQKIEQLCQAQENWIELAGRQFGEAKARLLSESAYGIHARPGEAFGIAIAEMIAAGCVPFVPAEGGPAEIVDHNPALVYDTPDEAVEKIDAMLRNPGLEAATRAFIEQQAQKFSEDSFERDICRIVSEFVTSQTRPQVARPVGQHYEVGRG